MTGEIFSGDTCRETGSCRTSQSHWRKITRKRKKRTVPHRSVYVCERFDSVVIIALASKFVSVLAAVGTSELGSQGTNRNFLRCNSFVCSLSQPPHVSFGRRNWVAMCSGGCGKAVLAIVLLRTAMTMVHIRRFLTRKVTGSRMHKKFA